MPDRFVESHIKQIPMFQNLLPQELDLIVNAFQVLRFQPGEVVVQEGNATQGLFILVSGQGVMTRQHEDGSARRVGFFNENDMLDRGALFETGVEPSS
ncbi:MAG: cyclic nucleotide-binding domain-containing protein, partial [Chloroflexota bacterium]